MRKAIEVAVLQFGSTLEKATNIGRALGLLDEIVSSGRHLDLVCLPELFTFRPLALPDDDEFASYVEPENGSLELELSRRAAELGAYVVGGTFLQEHDGRIYNTSTIFNRSGDLIGRYSKSHLFDAPGHSESSRVTPGDQLVTFSTDFGDVGVAVCYELRFPEVARALALAGATILAVPNSWPVDGLTLGSDQLRILLQATALQNQCFVVHANQFGTVGGLDLCGRSCVVDPKGEVIAQASDRAEVLYRRIDPGFAQEVRNMRTTFMHRRPDLYETSSVGCLSSAKPKVKDAVGSKAVEITK